MADDLKFILTDVPETTDELIAQKVFMSTGITAQSIHRIGKDVEIGYSPITSKVAKIPPYPVTVMPDQRLCYVALDFEQEMGTAASSSSLEKI